MNRESPVPTPGSPRQWLEFAESDLRLAELASAVREAGVLTPYAVGVRYAGPWAPVSDSELEEALRIAGQVVEWARQMILPTPGGDQ